MNSCDLASFEVRSANERVSVRLGRAREVMITRWERRLLSSWGWCLLTWLSMDSIFLLFLAFSCVVAFLLPATPC